MNRAGVAELGLKSLAVTRNPRIPRSSKKFKEKDNGIFQSLPVILRGIKRLWRVLLHVVKSLKKYRCQEINSQLINKRLAVYKETPSVKIYDSCTNTATSPTAAALRQL